MGLAGARLSRGVLRVARARPHDDGDDPDDGGANPSRIRPTDANGLLYPFVSHSSASVDLGQVGLLKVGNVRGR